MGPQSLQSPGIEPGPPEEQRFTGLGLVADPVTQAIGGSEFEDGLMPGSPGDV